MLKYIYLIVYVMLGFAKVGVTDDGGGGSTTALNQRLAANLDSLHYLNPVYHEDWADPTVWRGDDGMYYSLSTSAMQHVKAIQSPDLIHWERCKGQIIHNRTWTYLEAVGQTLKAPQMTTVAGRRQMYLSCSTSVDKSTVVVLIPDTTNIGQYKYKNRLVDSSTGVRDCTDPFVVEDPNTHRVWLFFGGDYGIYRIELDATGTKVAEGAYPKHVAGLDITFDRQRERVYQAPSLCYHDGYWYLFVSSGHRNSSNCTLRVGRSATLDGDFVDKAGKPMTQGNATTLFTAIGEQALFTGAGQTGEVFSDTAGRTYVVYSSMNSEDSSASTARPLMMQELLWDKQGWPCFKNNQPQWVESRPKL